MKRRLLTALAFLLTLPFVILMLLPMLLKDAYEILKGVRRSSFGSLPRTNSSIPDGARQRRWAGRHLQRVAAALFGILTVLSPLPVFAATVITTTTQTAVADAFNYQSGGFGEKVAQSFTATADGTITALTVNIGYNNNGTPNGTAKISINSDSSGSPGTELANGTIDWSVMPTDGTTVDFAITLNSTPTVVNGTTYWVVFQTGTASPSVTHYFLAGGDAVTTTYGTALMYDTGVWGARSKTYRAVITITSPSSSPLTFLIQLFGDW